MPGSPTAAATRTGTGVLLERNAVNWQRFHIDRTTYVLCAASKFGTQL